jgi:nitrate reductase NapAB chaperone NapD
MAVCSYLVIPEPGRAGPVAGRLAAIPGCEVTAAENRDVLLLVTESDGPEEEKALREELESVPGVMALVLTFGEIDPEAPSADSAERADAATAGLPVLGNLETLDRAGDA